MGVSKCLCAVFAVSLFSACSGTAAPPVQQRSPALAHAVNALAGSSAPQYQAVSLPTNFVPNTIMKDGRIPGYVSTSAGASAAIWRSGTLRIVGQYKGYPTFLTGVNSSGDAVGYASVPTKTCCGTPFIQYANGRFSAVPNISNCYDTLDGGGDRPVTINDAGDVYGTCWRGNESEAPSAARFAPGTPAFISGSLYGRGGGFGNVNSSGEFAYTAFLLPAEPKAASGEGLVAARVQTGYSFSWATWINDAGTVVGSATDSTTRKHIYTYVYPAGGPVKVLPLLGSATSMNPAGINKYGTIVGGWSDANASSGIFLYKSGLLYDVTNSITPAGSYSVAATGIADSGAFIGGANGQYYVIAPVK